MKNINFTDWQDLWLKKDVEAISKKLNRLSAFSSIVMLEIIIVVITLALGAISIINANNGKYNNNIIFVIIIALIAIAVLFPVIIFFIKRIKITNKIKNNKLELDEYYDIFDNKICNCIMMANSLCENIQTQNKDEAQYYICETSYYLNKCILEFFHMKSMAKDIFLKRGNKGIVLQRLLLVLKLIIKIRNEVNEKIKSLNDSDEIIVKYIIEENKRHNGYLNDFIICVQNNNIDLAGLLSCISQNE